MKGCTNIQHINKMPRRAILLAAGYGTRMEPLSWDLPKPLMPFFGVPLLEHALLTLEDWGVEDVLINLHHAPHEILEWFRARQRRGPRIVFSFEADILGTGGALRKAQHFIGSNPCWLVNTDIAFVMDPEPLVHIFYQHRPPAVLWLDAVRGPRTVACNEQGIIEDFAVTTPGVDGTYTYCGIQLFDPKLLQGLPERAFCSVIDACRQMMRDGHPVYGCVSPGAYWADLGTPERYLQAHAEAPEILRRRGGFSAAPPEMDKNVVLWSGASIATGGCAAQSIVGRGVRLDVPVRDACVVRADVDGMPGMITEVLRTARMKPSETLYIQLPRRGSDRSFVRMVAGNRSVIFVQYRADRRPENARYAGHARFLAARGVPVPRVLLSEEDKGILVLEDVGSQALQDISSEKRDLWYRRVMRNVARLHAIALQDCPVLEPAFDARLYAWEYDLFLEAYLCRHYGLTASEIHGLRRELGAVSKLLQRLPLVLVHRDLQSSNILLHGQKTVFIDFQGMRAGPAVYDLASLLYDPYVACSHAQRRKYLDAYLADASDACRAEIRSMLPVGGIQRMVQALGAFGRLGANTETARFQMHIPPARQRLEMLLQETGLCPKLLHWLQQHPVAVGLD